MDGVSILGSIFTSQPVNVSSCSGENVMILANRKSDKAESDQLQSSLYEATFTGDRFTHNTRPQLPSAFQTNSVNAD